MLNFLLVMHFIIALLLIFMIVIQKKESDGGGALGFGGGKADGVFAPRGEANLLTRTTGILAFLFFGNCLLIGKLVEHQSKPVSHHSIVDDVVKHTDISTQDRKEKSDNIKESDAKKSENDAKSSKSENHVNSSEAKTEKSDK